LTAAPRIKPTSTRRQSAWRLNPGRPSTYPRGDSVQTTGTSSVLNTGNTPAHKFTYWATARILVFPLPDDFEFPEGEDNLKAGFVLGPHQNIIINAAVPDFVDDNEVLEIKMGRDRRVYVWGVVFYEDAFGEPRQTKFCHSIIWVNGPQGELITGNYTAKYNEAN
jgi:hypothetical protein